MEAQRASELEVAPSGIMGYGKGKVLEKRVCTNCLRRGIECEWDEGGRGKSKLIIIIISDFHSNANRQVLPAMSEAKNPMHARRFRNLISEKASYGGSANSEACEEAKVGASGSRLGSKKT